MADLPDRLRRAVETLRDLMGSDRKFVNGCEDAYPPPQCLYEYIRKQKSNLFASIW